MRTRVTDVGPAVLVPAAWAVTLGAHTGVVSRRTVFIAVCVMDVLLVAFAVGTRREMTGPVLGVWRRVIVGGLVANLAGTVDMAVDAGSDPVLPLTVLAWMVLPGVAYLHTGRTVDRLAYHRAYVVGGALSLAGAVGYALTGGGAGVLGGSTGEAATVVGLLAVGVGQTAGILAAVVQNVGYHRPR